MKEAANFMSFDQSSLTFSITGTLLTPEYVGDHLIRIRFDLADGNLLKQNQVVQVKTVEEVKEEERQIIDSGYRVEMNDEEIEALEPIETKVTQIDAAGKFSVVFTRPIELKIGYINSQIKNTKSAKERKLQ